MVGSAGTRQPAARPARAAHRPAAARAPEPARSEARARRRCAVPKLDPRTRTTLTPRDVGADLRVAPPVDTGTPVSTRIFACSDLLTSDLLYLLLTPMQGTAGMAERWRQQQLQAMRCTEGRGGGGGGAPRHGCAREELGGRCHRARGRPRRSGCRAGGPSRNRARWALCRWKKFHRRGGARGDDKAGVRVSQGGGDGGRRERAAWPRPGGLPPSSLAPSHNYPFPPPHQHNPHHPCCESFTRSVHSASTVVLLL